MRLYRLLAATCLAFALCIASATAHAGETPAEHAANVAAQAELDSAPPHGNLPHYSLPPADLAKAQHISSMRNVIDIVTILWSLATFVVLLWGGVAGWMRDRAMAAGASLRARGKRFRAFWSECAVFTVLVVILTTLITLPLDIFRHALSARWGLSIQSWPSWFGDQGKSFLISLGLVFVLALLMFIMRWLPRTWWVAAWGALFALTVVGILVVPVYIDLLYNKFEPLAQSNPALVAQLEKIVQRGHMDIPPERMFLMKASAKVTTMNAYVTGFGASKRVVVWDTSLAKGTPDQVLFIFGHESGHYVLGHIRRAIFMSFFGIGLSCFIGFYFVRWSIRRFGARWRVSSAGDWAALVVLAFAFTLLNTLTQPITNTLSRMQEHAADVYGQEAIHTIVADPQATAVGAFDVLGHAAFGEPNEPRWTEVWFENHPMIGRRAAFAANYDPWAPGAEPKYFKK